METEALILGESSSKNMRASDEAVVVKIEDSDEDSINELEFVGVVNNIDPMGFINEAQENEENDMSVQGAVSIKNETSFSEMVKNTKTQGIGGKTVTINRFLGTHVDVNQSDQSTIAVFRKQFCDTYVALFKGHEYIPFKFEYDFEEAWRCNKCQACPAVLLIGRNSDNKVYEVSEHTCDEDASVLNNKMFLSYTNVNVIYYEGDNIPGLKNDCLSSVNSSTLILCQDEKLNTMKAFYNGCKYVKQATFRCFLKYRCSHNSCKSSLNISRAGISRKKVQETEIHTCKQNQANSWANKPIYVAEDGFTSVKVFHCKTNKQLKFFLQIYKLHPSSELLLISTSGQEGQKTVYYKGYGYCKNTSTAHDYYSCNTKWCSGKLLITADFNAVSEIYQHICSSEMASRISHSYTLFKISNISDMNFEDRDRIDNTSISLENSTPGSLNTVSSKSEYVRVIFKHLLDQNPSTCDLDPNDTNTVIIFANSHSQRKEYYYKGHTYHSGNRLQLGFCSKLTSCAAALILSQESSEVMEFGYHNCIGKPSDSSKQKSPSVVHNNEKTKSEIRSSKLHPILPKKKSPENVLPKSDSISPPRRKSSSSLKPEANFTELTSSYVYRDDAGQPIIYYKGYTYNCKSRTIYMCSKSLRCSAALRPDPTGKYEFTEIGEHNCFLPKNLINYSCKPESVKFRTYVANEFSEVPDFNPDDKTIVTMLLSRSKHNAVYYKGHVYVDDRGLSCERGSYVTQKSCNLLYMCIKSTTCSAGLLLNPPKTKARQIGLHNCLSENDIHSKKNFRELKLVKVYRSTDGKSDLNKESVATFCYKGKTSFYYNDFVYAEKATCCSSKLGCKCLYICENNGYCSAAILHFRREVLEVGLHVCRNDATVEELTDFETKEKLFTTPSVDYSSFKTYGSEVILKKGSASLSSSIPNKYKQGVKKGDHNSNKNAKSKFQSNVSFSRPNNDSFVSVDNRIFTENHAAYQNCFNTKERSLENNKQNELKIEETIVKEEHDYVADNIKKEVEEYSAEADRDYLKPHDTDREQCSFKTEYVHCTGDNPQEDLIVLNQNDPLSCSFNTTDDVAHSNPTEICEIQMNQVNTQIIASAIAEQNVINVNQIADENIGVYLPDIGCLLPSLVPFNIPKTTKTFSILPFSQENLNPPEDKILFQQLPKITRIESAVFSENGDVTQIEVDQGNLSAPILEGYLTRSGEEVNDVKLSIATGNVIGSEIRCPPKPLSYQNVQTGSTQKRKTNNTNIFEDIEDAIPATIVMSTKKMKM